MDKWFSVTVKFETIKEALDLAHKLSDQGLTEVTVDSSQWQEEEEEENNELPG